MRPHEKRAEATRLNAEARMLFDGIKSGKLDGTEEESQRQLDLLDKAQKLIDEADADEAREADLGRRMDVLSGRLGKVGGRQSDPLPHQDPANTGGGDEPRHSYSLLRAIRMRADGEKLDGIEGEVSQEIARRMGKKPQGFYVPWDLKLTTDAEARPARRDLNTTTGAGAVFEVTSTTMIEYLRNRMLTRQLGIRVMSGMQGNFSIPRQTGTTTAYWITEGNAPTESNPTLGAIDFTPKTVGAFTDYSRKFLLQTAVDAEEFIRTDLTTVIALELDRVVFNGSGTGAEPEGIIPNSSVNVVALGTNGAAPTWAKVVELESALEVDNTLVANLSLVTTPAAKAKLKTVEMGTAGYPIYLWGTDGVNGYPAYATNQMPANLSKGTATGTLSAAIFGDWSQAILALWTGIDVLVDPYTGGTAGNVRIVVLQDVDFKLRRPEAFAVMKDILP